MEIQDPKLVNFCPKMIARVSLEFYITVSCYVLTKFGKINSAVRIIIIFYLNEKTKKRVTLMVFLLITSDMLKLVNWCNMKRFKQRLYLIEATKSHSASYRAQTE